jgi:hypothetical protein
MRAARADGAGPFASRVKGRRSKVRARPSLVPAASRQPSLLKPSGQVHGAPSPSSAHTCTPPSMAPATSSTPSGEKARDSIQLRPG